MFYTKYLVKHVFFIIIISQRNDNQLNQEAVLVCRKIKKQLYFGATYFKTYQMYKIQTVFLIQSASFEYIKVIKLLNRICFDRIFYKVNFKSFTDFWGQIWFVTVFNKRQYGEISENMIIHNIYFCILLSLFIPTTFIY